MEKRKINVIDNFNFRKFNQRSEDEKNDANFSSIQL